MKIEKNENFTMFEKMKVANDFHSKVKNQLRITSPSVLQVHPGRAVHASAALPGEPGAGAAGADQPDVRLAHPRRLARRHPTPALPHLQASQAVPAPAEGRVRIVSPRGGAVVGRVWGEGGLWVRWGHCLSRDSHAIYRIPHSTTLFTPHPNVVAYLMMV